MNKEKTLEQIREDMIAISQLENTWASINAYLNSELTRCKQLIQTLTETYEDFDRFLPSDYENYSKFRHIYKPYNRREKLFCGEFPKKSNPEEKSVKMNSEMSDEEVLAQFRKAFPNGKND